MKKWTRLTRLRVAKYTTNFGLYTAIATAGVFAGLGDESLVITQLKLNPAVILPIISMLFGVTAITKDQLDNYFKLPKGVNTAIIFFILGFLGYLISYWVMVTTATYLFLTILNTLYWNPAIDEERSIKLEVRKEDAKRRQHGD